jgi:hypothetical protein
MSINNTRNKNKSSLGTTSVAGDLPIQFDTKSSLFMFFATLGHYNKRAVVKSKIGNSTLGGTAGVDYIDTTLGTWTAITDGEFAVTINGVANDITGLDFSGATDMDGVASVIQAGIRAIGTGGFTNAICVFDDSSSTHKYFKIGSGTNSDAHTSAITLLSAVSGGTGTDISGSGYLLMNTANGTVCYERTFDIKDCVPSLGSEKSFEQQMFRQTGLVLNQLGFTFDGSANDRTKITASFIGAKDIPVTSTAVTTLLTSLMSGEIYNQQEASVVAYDVTNTDTIVTRGKIKTLNLTLDNGAEALYALENSPESFSIGVKQMTVTGSIGVYFKTVANSFLEDGDNGVFRPIRIFVKKGADEIVFFLKDVKFEVTRPDMTNTVAIEYTLNFNVTDIEVMHCSSVTDDFTF